jgi:glycosyltransferase involved in cell wall biosynthesis
MSTLNAAPYIDETLESLRNQSLEEIEIVIVIDGPCFDQTIEICTKHKEKDERIILIKNTEHTGISKCRNQGILKSTGKYIAVADSDDIYPKNRLEVQYIFLEENIGIDILGCYKGNIGSEQIWKTPLSHDGIVAGLIENPTLPHPGVMMRKSIFEKIQYNINLSCAVDYDLWVQACKHHFKFANVDQVLVYQRSHKQQTSIIKKIEVEKNVEKIRESFLQNIINLDEYWTKISLDILSTKENITDTKTIVKWYKMIMNRYCTKEEIQKRLRLIILKKLYKKKKDKWNIIKILLLIKIIGFKRTIYLLVK